VGSQVVQRQGGALLERQAVRQREHRHGRDGGPLARSPVRQHADDSLPQLEARPAQDRAGHIHPEGEGRLGLQLVLPLAQQQVRERDPHGVHVDQHVVLAGDRFVDLADHDVGGTGGRDDLGSAHASIMLRSVVEVRGAPATSLETSECTEWFRGSGLAALTPQPPTQRPYPGLTMALASKCMGSV
jgi:hypothetical protein